MRINVTMRIMVDTSVLLRGILAPHRHIHTLIRESSAPPHTLLIADVTVTEVLQIIAHQQHELESSAHAFFDLLDFDYVRTPKGALLAARAHSSCKPDRSAMLSVFTCALAYQADVLVTTSRRYPHPPRSSKLSVCSPRAMLFLLVRDARKRNKSMARRTTPL